MSTTETGRRAEGVAAAHLQSLGYKVLTHNWRTRWCEIDLIVSKNEVVCFVEVKYRHSDWQGSGLEYIINKKLQQMQFAAAMWVQQAHWQGDYELGVIEVSGEDYRVTKVLFDL